MSRSYRIAVAESTNDVIKAGIEAYTGAEVRDLEVHEDARVPGAFGIRASFEDGSRCDFLLTAHWTLKARRLTSALVDEHLEEAEFTTWRGETPRWPPTEGRLKFFT